MGVAMEGLSKIFRAPIIKIIGYRAHRAVIFAIALHLVCRGAEPSLPANFFDSARTTAMLTGKITLPDSHHPVDISKNPGFRALYLPRRIEFRFYSASA